VGGYYYFSGATSREDGGAMKFLTGLIFGVLLVALVPAVLIFTGMFSMGAINKPSQIETKAGTWAWLTSAKKNAPTMKNPYTTDITLEDGMDHYKENCVVCHGAPGVEKSEIGKGLNPPAPVLDAPIVQQRTDGEIFWIIKNGIRMTGMPAFGPTHSDEEVWKLVQFVRHIPQLTAKEKEELSKATEEEEHHHGKEEGEEHQHEHSHPEQPHHH
jgi:mono/diheme cytochrome c family protein